MSHLCEHFGLHRSYLNNVESGKSTMSEERVFEVAEMLGTSFEYLMDLTDDPNPNFLLNTAGTLQDKIQNEVITKLDGMTDDQRKLLERVLKMSPEETKKVLAMLDLMER
jgi:transcriptional regulator with XRE-family HTH domain